MKIRKINITSFGNLKNVSYDFVQGINVIYGMNEAGKSTLLAFIKFIFYSIAPKIKHNNLLERERYMTFGEKQIDGNILFECGGREIIIERSYMTNAKQKISAIDCMTLEHITELEVSQPGCIIFEADADTFASTIFIRQGGVKIENNKSLGERLQNLAISGDEDISYNYAADKISKAARGLEFKTKPGKIAVIEAEIDNKKKSLDKAREDEIQYNHICDKYDYNKKTIENLNKKITIIKSDLENYDNIQEIKAARAVYELEDKIEKTTQRMQSIKDKLIYCGKIYKNHEIDSGIAKKDELICLKKQMDELKDKITAFENEIKNIKLLNQEHSEGAGTSTQLAAQSRNKKNGYKKFPAIIIPALVLAVMFVFFGVAGNTSALMYTLALLCFAIAVIFGFVYINKINTVKTNDGSVNDDYGKYAAADEINIKKAALENTKNEYIIMKEKYEKIFTENKEILNFINNTDISIYTQKLSEYENICAELFAFQKQHEIFIKDIDISKYKKEDIINFEKNDIKARTIQHEYEEMQSLINRIDKENAVLAAQAADFYKVNKSYSRIESEICYLCDKLSKLYESKQVYDTALEVLGKCRDELEQEISPRINEKASEYINIISGGKYNKLHASNNFEINLAHDYDAITLDYVSTGGRESAFIAVRLAIIDILYKNAPVFFDDSFINIDSGRLGSIQKLLNIYSGGGDKQILIFTCHERERDIFGKENNVHIA